MSDKNPNYLAIDPPDGKPVEDYSPPERRAEILQLLIEAGSPFAIKQCRLADRYGVHESTISRDMDRLRESVDHHLGADAKLTTRAVFEKTVRELQAEGEWKSAWDVVMDWSSWLADRGAIEREPMRSELDVRQATVDVAYRVVREGDPDEVLDADPGELGFSAAPAELPTGESDV